MQGKYSPTVAGWYSQDQKWWYKNRVLSEDYQEFDKDGYDSYGYNSQGVDRAEVHENDYACDDELFQEVCSDWWLKPARFVI